MLSRWLHIFDNYSEKGTAHEKTTHSYFLALIYIWTKTFGNGHVISRSSITNKWNSWLTVIAMMFIIKVIEKGNKRSADEINKVTREHYTRHIRCQMHFSMNS